MKIKIKEISPVLTSKEIGEKLLKRIKSELNSTKKIELDFNGFYTMTTSCAKQIFGSLYKDMGPKDFYEKIVITNINEDLKLIINQGIENALD